MKFIRYTYQGKIACGILADSTVKEIRGSLFDDHEETGFSIDSDSVDLLCPCEPTKILAVGLNYRSHIKSFAPDNPEPENPEIFFKPPSALVAHGCAIQIPPNARKVHYEGELVAVIGKTTCNVSVAEAEQCIFGFACGIDVSERIWQKNDLQWWRAKGCDTFAPFGPVVVTNFDWKNGGLQTRVNGSIVQSGTFNELLFNPPAIVSYVSQHLTLLPGDLIYTGTPGSTGQIKAGDVVEVEIPGIGILRNPVVNIE
jgi:2-keto-4-pentenoate hydratase/2-oxohepta-3-ene-1,7-dioic acid hydratase in catechol pathway